VITAGTERPTRRGVDLARSATGLLRSFNEAGVLVAADVHVARYLGRLGPTDDESVLLGAALAVRAPRLGHTCVDLATIRETADTDVDTPVDLDALGWPEQDDWVDRLGTSVLVGEDRPLRLEGSTLYLDRYWSDEQQVARDLLARAGVLAPAVDLSVLRAGVERMLRGDTDVLQRLAAATAVLRRFTVVAGGPGTGKTTTVARILALVDEQWSVTGSGLPLVALAAPTGKAAARLEQSVHEEATSLDADEAVKEHLGSLAGTTIHRLLGFDPGNRTRFRYNRMNPLPHDVVVVDETSMVALSLMARLAEAVRADARLILVGDPQQLASVEAGAVLGDVVGPATSSLEMRQPARDLLSAVTGDEVHAVEPAGDTPIGDGIVVLRRVHRFGAGIARFAEAVRSGDSDDAIGILRQGVPDVGWIEGDADLTSPDDAHLEPLRDAAVESGRRVVAAAIQGDALGAISALGSFRLLCAHRRGPVGARSWATYLERWMAAGIEGFAPVGQWYVGRPLLVTANDYSLGLHNGDTGVVIADPDGHVTAAFERSGGVVNVSPSRLAAVETVYAMTVHKSQGSQFDTVALILPGPESRVLTRELLYTAVTRARHEVMIVGTEMSLRTAVERPIARSSGLRGRLWGI
jgi:exodeoxyribonuclease V alpha subunit